MGSPVRVILDNYHDVCYPGQTIAGRVECHFNKQKNLRAVRIKFKGKAETGWWEDESYYDESTKKNETKRVRYSADESYFDAEYILVQGGDNFSLSSGRHTYPFSYILPNHLPSSFEGSEGHIRYYIKATIDRPWKFDYDHQISLNILSPLDLNYLPELREPINSSVDKTMCSCWCNDSGILTFNISLPAKGFVPGQEISIGAHIENMTNVSADCVKFKIVQNKEFVVHYPSTKTRHDSIEITSCREGGVGAHGDKSWTSRLTIPPGNYPNLKGCSIIRVYHILKAKVVLPCPHVNLSNDQDITIGTVPLTGVITNFPAGPPLESQYSIPITTVSDQAPLIDFPSGNLPYPPSVGVGGFGIPPPMAGAFGDNKSVGVGGFGLPPAPVGGYGEKSPSAPPGDVPYPPAGASAPYPPGGAPNPGNFSSAPPSYEEAQKFNEKPQ